MHRAAQRRLGDHQLVERNRAPAQPGCERRRAARQVLFVGSCGDQQIAGRPPARLAQLREQRQRDRQAGLGIHCAAPVHAAVAQLAAKWLAQHLLGADRIHMHIQRGPALARPTPIGIDIQPVGQHLFDLHLAAKLAEPGGQGLGHAHLARRSGAWPGLLGGDTGDADEAPEPGGELFATY